jgi:hypothetical protein
MAPAWPATLVASLAAFRQPCPAPPFTYGRGAGWALAMLGSPRQRMCNRARRGPAGVRQTWMTLLRRQLGARLFLWGAWWAAGETTLRPQGRGNGAGSDPAPCWLYRRENEDGSQTLICDIHHLLCPSGGAWVMRRSA